MKYIMSPLAPIQFIYDSIDYLTEGGFTLEDITQLNYGHQEVLSNHVYIMYAGFQDENGDTSWYHLFMKDNSSNRKYIRMAIKYNDVEKKWYRLHIDEISNFGKLYNSWKWALLKKDESFINWRIDPFTLK